MKQLMVLIFSIFFISISPLKCFSIDLGTDVFISAKRGNLDEISFRSRSGILIDLFGIQVGGLLRYEPQHSYLTDISYGPMFRYGRNIVFELDAGILERTFEGVLQKGFVIGLLVGWQFTPTFRVSLPITFKRLDRGSVKKWITESVPHFGIKIFL